MAELLISAVPSGVTGWRSLALGDELTGAALDVLALGDELTGSRPTLALVAAAPNSQESGPMPSKRPISWGSARNRRDRTGREAVEMAGVVLGYRASWHDRGPGGRSDSGC